MHWSPDTEIKSHFFVHCQIWIFRKTTRTDVNMSVSCNWHIAYIYVISQDRNTQKLFTFNLQWNLYHNKPSMWVTLWSFIHESYDNMLSTVDSKYVFVHVVSISMHTGRGFHANVCDCGYAGNHILYYQFWRSIFRYLWNNFEACTCPIYLRTSILIWRSLPIFQCTCYHSCIL